MKVFQRFCIHVLVGKTWSPPQSHLSWQFLSPLNPYLHLVRQNLLNFFSPGLDPQDTSQMHFLAHFGLFHFLILLLHLLWQSVLLFLLAFGQRVRHCISPGPGVLRMWWSPPPAVGISSMTSDRRAKDGDASSFWWIIALLSSVRAWTWWSLVLERSKQQLNNNKVRKLFPLVEKEEVEERLFRTGVIGNLSSLAGCTSHFSNKRKATLISLSLVHVYPQRIRNVLWHIIFHNMS
jgi:hypothetical protein